MAIRSGFFNSRSGDRKYDAEQMSRYFDKLITSGVFPNPSTQLQVVATDGMILNVLPGRGIVDCHWMDNDSNHSITIDTSDAVLNRIDAVVMKLDLTEDIKDIRTPTGYRSDKGSPISRNRNSKERKYTLTN